MNNKTVAIIILVSVFFFANAKTPALLDSPIVTPSPPPSFIYFLPIVIK